MRITGKTLTATSVLLVALLAALPASAGIEADFPEVVLFATNSMEIESSAQVFTGDVVVNQELAGTLSFGNKAKTPAGWQVKANTIDVGNNVTLAGEESCNFGNFSPCDFSLTTSVYGVLPLFQTSTPGGTNLNVPNSGSATVSGDALDITIGLEGTVTFTPGVHSVRSITASKKADLVFSGPTELRIENGITMGVEANINLSGAVASQVIFYVGGDATLGPKSTVNANVYTETGTLVISGNVTATGAFLAEDLIVETKAKINLATFFDSPPVANDDTYSVDEDTQLADATVGALGNGVLANDTDAENDLLAAILVTDVLHGDLTLNLDGSFTYHPDADYYGGDSFVYMACDELPYNVDNCDNALVSITVDPINDVPSFTAGADPVVSNEDAGGQSVAWATDISAGAGDETDQTVSFNVSNSDNTLFSTQPSLSANGTLTYTSAPDANGSATVTVSLSDDCPAPPFSCGVSGQLTSADQIFTITVTAVNDEPSFTKGPDQLVLEDVVAQNVTPWATGLSAGPANESGQTLSFNVTSNTNPGLFSAGPAINASGDLSYTPAADANGSADVTIEIMDDGGTANGGDDTSPTQTFTVAVTSVNDPPVAVDDAASTPEETQITLDLVGNDSAGPANELATLTLQPLGGIDIEEAVIVANQLVYTPPQDFFGERVFQYSVCDSGDGDDDAIVLCDSGTLVVTVTNVNDAPTANPQDLFATAMVTITLTGSDPDGDSLVFSLDSGPTPPGTGTLGIITPIVPSGGGPVISATVDFTPAGCSGNPLECPESSFTFQVDDGSLSDTADVTINPGGDPGCADDSECDPGFFCKLPEGICEPDPLVGIVAKDKSLELDSGDSATIVLEASAPQALELGAIGDLSFAITSGTPSLGSITAGPTASGATPVRSATITYDHTGANGTETITFDACEAAVPTNCDSGTVSIVVAAHTDTEPPVAEPVSAATTAVAAVTFSLVARDGNPPDDPPVGDGGRSLAPVSMSAAGSPDTLDNGSWLGASSGIRSGAPTPLAPLGVGSGWQEFTWWDVVGAGAPVPSPTFVCTGPGDLVQSSTNLEGPFTFVVDPDDEACLSVTDVLLTGDQFRILNFGQEIDTTTAVPRGGPSLGDPDDAFASSAHSHRLIPLPAGSYSIEIEAIPGASSGTGSFWCGRGDLRVDTVGSGNCDAQPPLLTYAVLTVPDVSFGTLLDSNQQTVTVDFGPYVLPDASLTFVPNATATGTNNVASYQATNTATLLTSNVAFVDLAIVAEVLANQCQVDEQFCDKGRDFLLGGGQGPVSGGSTGGLRTGPAFTVAVTGPGDIGSSRPHVDGKSYSGLVCGSDESCSANFVRGSTVVLYARPVGAKSEFVEWGGDCEGTDPVVLVRAGTDTFCVATFRERSE